MIKRFCDVCGEEITERNQAFGGAVVEQRLGTEVRRRRYGRIAGGTADVLLKVEVIHSVDGVSNAGDVCKYCVIDALNTLDDRAKVTSAR